MARAHSIYIVRDLHHAVQAAFTVKHECKRWLSNRSCFKYLVVLTQRDGSRETGKQVTAAEFMA